MTGTRTQVLEDIAEWYNNCSPGTPPVFWINGIAGTGKSTIAKTVAQRAASANLLGASFFLSRRAADARLRDPMAVIPTLVYQLAAFSDSYKIAILDALKKNLDVADLDLESQVKFLSEALLTIKSSSMPLVVLDAFDECDDGQDRFRHIRLLQLLLRSLLNIPALSFKLLITSRPEIPIQKAFDTLRTSAGLILHNIETEVVEGDIRLFLETSFKEIACAFDLPDSPQWFLSEEIMKLVQSAGKLFVYAATAVRFVSSDPPGRPRAQLNKILLKLNRNVSAFAELDALYLEILSKVASQDEDSLREFRLLIGTVILLRDVLPVSALERLLGISQLTAYSITRTLTSVIAYPTDHTGSFRFYHPSFPEFVTDAARCVDFRVYISIADHERELAVRCLTAISDSEEAQIRIPSDVSDELLYSCIYWASHLTRSPEGDSSLMKLVDTFTQRDIVRWLEVASLRCIVPATILALREAESWAVRDIHLIGDSPDGNSPLVALRLFERGDRAFT
jgi:hypothetical protein